MIRRIRFVTTLMALALCLCACKREARPLQYQAGAPMAALAAAPAAMMRTADNPDRRIAYTQNFVLELPKEAVQPAIQRATEVVLAAGGTVLNTRVDRLPNGAVQGSMSVRIPPDKYQAFAAGLTAPPARLVSH